MWEGPEETLTLTANAQPGVLMTVSMAIMRTLEARDFQLQGRVDYGAGGTRWVNIRALRGRHVHHRRTASFSFAIRGKAMQQAVPVGEGAMAAIIRGSTMNLSSRLPGSRPREVWPDRQRQWRRADTWSREAKRPWKRRRGLHRKAGAQAARNPPAVRHRSIPRCDAGRRCDARRAFRSGPRRNHRCCRVVSHTSWSNLVQSGSYCWKLGFEQGHPGSGCAGARRLDGFPPTGVTTLFEVGSARVLSCLARRIKPGDHDGSGQRAGDIDTRHGQTLAEAEGAIFKLLTAKVQAVFDLTGRRPSLTGATGGIGEAVARMLHPGRRHCAACTSRASQKLEALAADLGERTEDVPRQPCPDRGEGSSGSRPEGREPTRGRQHPGQTQFLHHRDGLFAALMSGR